MIVILFFKDIKMYKICNFKKMLMYYYIRIVFVNEEKMKI